jgi:hypothetical protein
MKTSETKSLLRFFARHFWCLTNILLQPSRTYFHFYKKGFIKSQAVRIRVKYWTIDDLIRKVRVPKEGRPSGASHMCGPHVWCLICAVRRGVDCNEQCAYAALIIHCVDYLLRWLYTACVDWIIAGSLHLSNYNVLYISLKKLHPLLIKGQKQNCWLLERKRIMLKKILSSFVQTSPEINILSLKR